MIAVADSLERKRILVVDDHEDSLDLVREILASAGHDVVTALDGELALRVLAAESFDIALVDIGLPLVDGYAVARAARARFGEEILLVAVTGYGAPRDRARAIEAGFDRHVVKPLDVAAVLGAVCGGRGDVPPSGTAAG
jgi:CheY-like chemotaxis protein